MPRDARVQPQPGVDPWALVSGVVVGHDVQLDLGMSFHGQQHRWGEVQSPDLGLSVHAEHGRFLGHIDVEAGGVADLGVQLRIGGELERLPFKGDRFSRARSGLPRRSRSPGEQRAAVPASPPRRGFASASVWPSPPSRPRSSVVDPRNSASIHHQGAAQSAHHQTYPISGNRTVTSLRHVTIEKRDRLATTLNRALQQTLRSMLAL